MNHIAIFFKIAKFMLGESTDEERNEESRPEEESCPEEEREVAGAGPVRDLKQVHSKAPRNRGLFIFSAEEF